MSLFIITLQTLAPLFLLIALGYGLKRLRVLHTAHVPIMNGLVTNVTLPALVILGLVNAPPMNPAYTLLPLAVIAAQVITMGIAYAASRAGKLPRSTQGALMLVGVFGNTGFLGYPISLAVMPQLFPAAILIDQFGMTIMLFLVAPLLGARFGKSSAEGALRPVDTTRFLRSPLFISLLLAMVLREVPWPAALLSNPAIQTIGHTIAQCLTYLGQGTTPVVLLALGVALRPSAAREKLGSTLLGCGLKLLAVPALVWVICYCLGVHGDLLKIGILMASMPTAVMASVLTAENDMDGDFAVGVVFVSTIISAITMPLLQSMLR